LVLNMVDFAQYALLIILSFLLVLHFCIILKIIPSKIVWGNRLKSEKEMYRFEIISIIFNVIFLFFVLVHSDIWMIDFSKITMTIILWIMTIFFAFNTLSNILSKNKLEQRIFIPITILLTIFSLVLALSC
jgi:hypothetical protein